MEWGKRHGKALSTVVISKKKEASNIFGDNELREALRDSQISMLAKITDKKVADEIVAKLKVDFPEHLPLLLEQLKRVAEEKVRKRVLERINVFSQDLIWKK